MPQRNDTICQFLAVENHPDDGFLLLRAFEKVRAKAHVHLCRNVGEAKAFISGAGIYSDRIKHPFPDVVLAHLNIPEENALDLLRWVREEANYRNLPFIIFSGSVSPDQAKTIMLHGASRILERPKTQDHLIELLQNLIKSFCKI